MATLMLQCRKTLYRQLILILISFCFISCSSSKRSQYIEPTYSKYNQYGVSLIVKRGSRIKHLESHTILNSGNDVNYSPFQEVYRSAQFTVFEAMNNSQIFKVNINPTNKHEQLNISEYISKNTLDYLKYVIPDIKFNFIIRLLPNGINVNEIKTHKVLNSVLTLDFTFNLDEADILNSANDIIRTLVHEALHAGARLNKIQFPNKLSEETTVYVNEVCAELMSTNKLEIPSFKILPDDNFMAHVYNSNSPRIIKNMQHLGYSIIAKTLAQKVIWDLNNISNKGRSIDHNEIIFENCKKLYNDTNDFYISLPSYIQ